METEERDTLKCGHEFKGQARCGLCDSCWECCSCGTRKASESRARPAPIVIRPLDDGEKDRGWKRFLPEAGTAEIVGRTPRVGRATVDVLCCCGATSTFFEWAWSGNGKAKCSGCKKWIFRLGLRVE